MDYAWRMAITVSFHCEICKISAMKFVYIYHAKSTPK
jgi:hypothetical protein